MLEELKKDITNADNGEGYKREEIYPLIIETLEEENLLQFSTSSRSLLNRNSLIEAFSQNETPFWKVCGYGSAQPFSNALARAGKLVNKPKEIQWDSYLISLVGYNYCKTCNTCKQLEYFSKASKSHYGKLHKCKNCEAERHIVDKKIVIKELENTIELKCDICKYNNNFAALDFHHIDANIKRPEWAIGRTPSTYLLLCSPEEIIKRYKVEENNLQILCHNCHQKEHNTTNYTQDGLKQALSILGKEYKCEVCEENINLHLHHNNPKDKECSFHDFGHQSSKKIIDDGKLKTELNKDVSILCGNHHAEIHNKKYFINNTSV